MVFRAFTVSVDRTYATALLTERTIRGASLRTIADVLDGEGSSSRRSLSGARSGRGREFRELGVQVLIRPSVGRRAER
jgi:hypothetical protein